MKSLIEFRRQERLMGSAFEFIVSAEKELGSLRLDECVSEVQRLEELLTEFKETSETSRINRNAGIKPVRVSLEVFQIIKRSVDLSRLTQGAFDITASGLKKLYNFKKVSALFPDADKISQALSKVGSDKIRLKAPHSVYLTIPGMHIGFGGIGKGYAADKVKSLMVSKGVESGVINASGDLTVWGKKPDGTARKVGIADPDNPGKILMWIPLIDACAATSGDYEQFFEWQGTRYSHTIDPKTGMPVQGVRSVTIISPSAELCDALATAVTVLGAKVGLYLIEQLEKTHAIVITDKKEVLMSKGIQLILNP